MGIPLGNPCLRRTSPEGVNKMASMRAGAGIDLDRDVVSWGGDRSLGWIIFALVILVVIVAVAVFWLLPMFW